MTNARDLIASWAEKHDTDPEKPAIPAATVIVLRDSPSGIETLLLRRNSKLKFAGGMWVFPGGRIDPEDYQNGPDDQLAAAQNAAVREAFEESGQRLDPTSLQWFAHWSPPSIAPKRFATWFFLAPASDDDVAIDHGEIHDSSWSTPAEALRLVDAREIEVAPPTWVTLYELAKYNNAQAALDGLGGRDPRFYVTKVAKSPDGPVAMWEGDAGYETGDIDAAGLQHRLVMGHDGFRFCETAVTPDSADDLG